MFVKLFYKQKITLDSSSRTSYTNKHFCAISTELNSIALLISSTKNAYLSRGLLKSISCLHNLCFFNFLFFSSLFFASFSHETRIGKKGFRKYLHPSETLRLAVVNKIMFSFLLYEEVVREKMETFGFSPSMLIAFHLLCQKVGQHIRFHSHFILT